jgi:hypothetical protein
MFVTLVPKTRQGQDIVITHGPVWHVRDEAEQVQFTRQPGPWILLETRHDMRWIHLRNDENFLVEPYGSDLNPDHAEALRQQLMYRGSQATSRTSMRRSWVPQLIVSLMLLWALDPDNPYGYYILLRWISCAVFAYLAFQALSQKKQGWVWVLGITAVVYNPIIRVHLNRETWSIINVISIGIAVASIFAVKVKDEKNDTA